MTMLCLPEVGAVGLIAPVVVVVAAVKVGEPLHVVAHEPGEQPLVPVPLDGRGADNPRLVSPVIDAEIPHGLTAVCEDFVTIPMRERLIPWTSWFDLLLDEFCLVLTKRSLEGHHGISTPGSRGGWQPLTSRSWPPPRPPGPWRGHSPPAPLTRSCLPVKYPKAWDFN